MRVEQGGVDLVEGEGGRRAEEEEEEQGGERLSEKKEIARARFSLLSLSLESKVGVKRAEKEKKNSSPLRLTWKLAGEPDSDCTLTPHFSGSRPKAASARCWQRVSAWSMNSLPP